MRNSHTHGQDSFLIGFVLTKNNSCSHNCINFNET
nr:MAG TPA: hypothetical protein [Caudoviricetes sp.]